jgi:hypothetical protein
MGQCGDDRGREDPERETQADSSKCQNDAPTVLLESRPYAPC